MGAPEGHPFFGNQYTNGGYRPGSFTYITEPLVEKVIDGIQSISKNVAEKPVKPTYRQSLHTESKASKFFENVKSKEIIIVGGVLLAVTAVGCFVTYKLAHRKKKETVSIENVGVCGHCGKPLSGSIFHPKDEQLEIEAYIQCECCGTKNYAHYNDVEESLED